MVNPVDKRIDNLFNPFSPKKGNKATKRQEVTVCERIDEEEQGH